MVDAADPHHYEMAIATMPRKKLEEFALQAARTMEILENENLKLTQDVDDSKKIDIEVINGWRNWSQVIDEERAKWSSMATRLSEENEKVKVEYKQAVEVIEAMLDIFGTIASQASEDSEEGTNAKNMRRGLKKIAKMAKAAIAKYAVVEEEEPEKAANEPEEDGSEDRTEVQHPDEQS